MRIIDKWVVATDEKTGEEIRLGYVEEDGTVVVTVKKGETGWEIVQALIATGKAEITEP